MINILENFPFKIKIRGNLDIRQSFMSNFLVIFPFLILALSFETASESSPYIKPTLSSSPCMKINPI